MKRGSRAYHEEVVPGVLIEALVDREGDLLHGLTEVARVGCKAPENLQLELLYDLMMLLLIGMHIIQSRFECIEGVTECEELIEIHRE